jgi:hypothetical protein
MLNSGQLFPTFAKLNSKGKKILLTAETFNFKYTDDEGYLLEIILWSK